MREFTRVILVKVGQRLTFRPRNPGLPR